MSRRIEVKSWKETRKVIVDPKTKKTKDVTDEVSILTILGNMLANRKPEDIPKGYDDFRRISRVGRAFDKADKSNVLELEEADYGYLHKLVDKNIVETWGLNKDISVAVETFMEAKSTESK